MATGKAARLGMGRFARTLMAAVLAVSLAPAVPAAIADEGNAQDVIAGDERATAVADMLAAGNYVEGEAIAIVSADAEPDTLAEVEQLAEIGNDSVELAASAAEQTECAVDDTAALRVQDAAADFYDVKLVVDHERTTEQILLELYDDPNVISAEPNYTYEPAEALEGAQASEPTGQFGADALIAASPSLLETQETTDMDPYSLNNTGDLTGYQWAYGNAMSTPDATSAPVSGGCGYSLNVPGWTEGRTNDNAEANASGTVCIMDMGLDPKHPDLQGVLYEFSPDQQAEYGCGQYGYNASGDEYPIYTMRPSGEHGMHVAGIVASAWNDQGMSGIAHGIKIFGVNVFGGNGQVMRISSVVKGFQFLVKAAKDVNLKAVNCSWGTKQTCFALGTMINELGKQGVNTVIATGNDHENLDDRMELASQPTNSPYAIRVNAAGPDGKPTMFTSYGQTASDVFSPGEAILSTYPVTTLMTVVKNIYVSRHVRFFPAGAGAENLLAYEKFDSGSGVRFFDANPALDAAAKELTPTAEKVGYGDRHSVSFNAKSFKTEKHEPTGDRQYDMRGLVGVNGYVYLAIPVDSSRVADAKWVSVSLAVNDDFRSAGGVATLTYQKAGKQPSDPDAVVEVDTTPASILKQGWESGATTGMYQVHWNTSSFFSEAIAQCANEAHKRIEAGEKFQTEGEPGVFTYKDPGEVSGLYGWKPDGDEQTYVIAKVALGDYTQAPSDTTKLYFDDVAVGSSYAGGGAFANMSGTSMASPAVAGCLAVIAKDEPDSSTLTDAQLAKEARERAAKLMASVDYDDDLAKLCRTGGRVNLAANPGFTKKAPLVTCAESDGSALTVSGYYFGPDGTIAIDGAAFTPSSWTDEKITVPVSNLERGSHVVKVVNADGAISQVKFSHSSTNGTGAALYEHDLTLPTSVPSFNMQDRVWGSLVAFDGAIYGIASSSKFQSAQGIWRYDIAKDAWSSIAMPDSFLNSSVTMNNMAAYNGALYLIGECRNDDNSIPQGPRLWCYDSALNAWTNVDMALPTNSALCVHKGKLFLVGGVYPEELSNLKGAHFALLDPEQRQISKVNETDPSSIGLGNRLTIVSTNNNMYCYSFSEDDMDTNEVTVNFQRLTYNEATNTMAIEDLYTQFSTMAPSLATSGEDAGVKAHFALAGLPDGVAVIGSKEKGEDAFDLGHDTFVIYDNSKTPVRLDRTSTYYRAFDPMAVYANGRLYALGYSPAEPHIAYFRSTDLWDTGTVTKEATCTAAGERTYKCLYREASYTEAIPALGHAWDSGAVTQEAAPGVAGVRTFKCTRCDETRTEAIAALPGGAQGESYVVAGNAYKVKSNEKNAVTFAKAKAAKNVKVPATVDINGKTYKVVAVGAKAFASAKKKLTAVTIGKNVTAIAKSAFAGCGKLAKVKGGASVKRIGKLAFSGCKALSACDPLASKKLAKVGKAAFKGTEKLKKATIKSKGLKKGAVKGSLKGSSIKTVIVKIGSSKTSKAYAKKYKKLFAKSNSGKKVAMRAQVVKRIAI